MILCSLSCTEQSLMARDRGQELSLAGHSGWLCSGGRGDAGLSPAQRGGRGDAGVCAVLAGPQL